MRSSDITAINICPADEGKCPIIDLNQKVNHSERILLDVNGNNIPIIKNVVPVNLNGRDCLLESFIDIQERQIAEEALKKSEKEIPINCGKISKSHK